MNFYRFSRNAQADLGTIWDHIAIQNGAPEAADRLLVRFYEEFRLLGSHPLMGCIRKEFGRDLRSIPVGDYLIFYRPLKSGVEIVRVLHGAQNLGRLFGSRRQRV